MSEDADTGAADRGAAPSRVLAVDGNALGHRAYHATRTDDEADRDGVVTAVVASMLATVWVHGPYDVVAIAFDDTESERRLLDPTYKAHRTAPPPDLPHHLALLARHLADADLPVLVSPGAEADDVLVAVADGAVARGRTCDVLSPDRDLIAVVGPGIRLLRTRRRFGELAVEDAASLEAAYGVPPDRYHDLAALRGDPSDGLPGAPGIGERTAARLVRDHGSLLGVLDAIPDLPPRIAGALRGARERLELNRLLMSPWPIATLDLEALLARRVELAALVELVEDLGFPRAATRLARAIQEDAGGGRAARSPARAAHAAPLPPLPPPPEVPPDR